MIALLIVIVLSIIVMIYSDANIHYSPAVVHVHGYTRRDGTYVEPYDRRASGMAEYDNIRNTPYRTEENVALVIFFGSMWGLLGVKFSD